VPAVGEETDRAVRERKTIAAANQYRDALYALDAELSDGFKKSGMRAIDVTNAAIGAMASLLAAYRVFMEGEGMTVDQFEDAVIGTVRKNAERLGAAMSNPAQKH
jgi:hypothetical protein